MIDQAEAVRRALNSDQYTGGRSPAAVRSWIRRLVAGIDDPQLVARTAGKLWLSPVIHPAFSEVATPERIATEILTLPVGERNKVAAKIRAIRGVRQLRRSCRLSLTQARRRFVEELAGQCTYKAGDETRTLPVSIRSLERWQTLFDDGGADALADNKRGRHDRLQPSPEAVELYLRWRHDPRRFAVTDCFRKVAYEAERKRWRWFAKYEACKKWDQRTRDERALVLNREGEEAYTRRCASYVEIDPESFAPGECWVGDDHNCDVWVRMPGGEVIRPVLSAWMDWRSRTIVGWQIIRSGNEHALLLAFSKGAEDHRHIPRIVVADNGKNFTSWQWRGDRPKYRVYRRPGELAGQLDGIFALANIQASWALPYNPNGKARIERWFRTFESELVKNLPSYCGSCPDDRPDEHKNLVAKAVPWDQFIGAVRQYIPLYNSRPHSAEDMMGRSPLQVLATATSLRVLPESVRPLLLAAWHRPVSIGRNGVAIRICGHTTRYGVDEPAIKALPIGTKVRVSYDPEDMGSIVVWTMDYKWICQATSNQKLNRAVSTEALREAMRKRNREKRAHREALKVGLEHLRDPVQRAVAALERDSRRNRLPDPTPDGTPGLVPVLTPFEVPERAYRKQAVGAENMDVLGRFRAAYSKPVPGAKRDTAVGALRRMLAKKATSDEPAGQAL